jgi:hypothetical protein
MQSMSTLAIARPRPKLVDQTGRSRAGAFRASGSVPKQESRARPTHGGRDDLPASPPRSSNRTCLRQLSPSKREFLLFGLETFGKFSLELPFLGGRRLNGSAKNACKLQGFRAFGAHSHGLSEVGCLAEDQTPTFPIGNAPLKCL